MQLTPSSAYEHTKESVIEYLETAYKIADPSVYAERGEILRTRGVVAQAPFIEATPAFPTAHKLLELERLYPKFLPEGLAELVQHGVPVDRFPLYTHQEQSLVAAFSDKPDLLVATGTGSGKTEAFLLPILADILREAQTWPEIAGPPQPGFYDAQNNVWLNGRRHENRPAALRAIVLYPMNALVNDQLSRLRRILARGTSPDWQRRNLKGNVIHFGMYTSISKPTGSWMDKGRRDRFQKYIERLAEEWQKLREDLKATGGWPRPDSPEMLCRWDIQVAPPDILVTNYSMLEYMLVRPIEFQIFEKTRQWLHNNPDARLTLVLDEAHTYTGAKGTEVAHLVRRLKERLGIESGSPKFRAIATTASLPNIPGAEKELRSFTSDLFGEPPDRFTLIRLPSGTTNLPARTPKEQALRAFAVFQDHFDIQDPVPAIEQLTNDLQLGILDRTVDPQIGLFSLLEKNQDIAWVRQRTARNATLLDQLAKECWQGLGTPDERERATAGIISAGSFAHPSVTADVPPLLSVRIHGFFRGTAGIWACMDPDCSAVPEHMRISGNPRPVGKIYTEPRTWCDCGGRVLELFSCRHCGLLFLGGIPDRIHESLWPWSDDLSGERQDLKQFRIFGVEKSHPLATPEYRSTRTTLHTHSHEPFARAVYKVEAVENEGRLISPFPNQCPRCQNYRSPEAGGREVIEPLRTKGPRSFSIVVEDGFRVQPRAARGILPNYGRKALTFSDSRQDAAILAADLRTDHGNDLFRQLLYRALYSCPNCSGSGQVEEEVPYRIGQPEEKKASTCPVCGGTGRVSKPSPLRFVELRGQVVKMQLQLGIDPTNGKDSSFFTDLDSGDFECYSNADMYFNLGLRRELAEDEFSLEPLGLASWRVKLPENFGAFPPLTDQETHLLVRCIARLLATEKILLPPQPFKPWEWPKNLIKDYDRNVMIPGYKRQGNAIPYNLEPRRKLGRYVIAISRALVERGLLRDETAANKWVKDNHWPLWKALTKLNVLQWAGAKINDQVPHGIRIDSFELHPIGDTVQQCQSCRYVMSEALFNVCLRCGQPTQPMSVQSLQSFYRRSAQYALPGSMFDDPYPLRAIEHTAQIPGAEARDLERWFQDLFHDDQNSLDYRIDVLSVTTTMEMGIDIGSLLCVGLRNVPPTVANYQQRSGRAGRRGSAVATVLTFAQARSHDQYFFDRPPEIVSEPPRVPALYLSNEVIARRHVRSLVLQDFFYKLLKGRNTQGLFSSWGTVGDFINYQTADKLKQYLATNEAPLVVRCTKIVDPSFIGQLGVWLGALVGEVQSVVNQRDFEDDLFEELINAGMLPKYAFPVDVVSLSVPSPDQKTNDYESFDSDSMQRDLKIALAEYAPGAEVIKGSFPHTYIYRIAAIYDPFDKKPNYKPTGELIECRDCQSITLAPVGAAPPDQCPECQSINIVTLPYLRPSGFSVDFALPDAGARRYEGGGRELSGYTAPARLLVGQTAFSAGKPQMPYAPHLYSYVRVGELFISNKGPDRDFPGYMICPVCGRAFLGDTEPGPHTYPANIPPQKGRYKGPRAGQPCPNRTNFQNQVILGYRFHSEVILLGVDLPSTMDAPFIEPSGKAVWYSFGTLLANAASLVLQVDPGELKVGVRAIRRAPERIHGEVFLYDDVPGGAGYARAIEQNLKAILEKALELGRKCENPECPGACYHCMYDYRNQMFHPLLDRYLGTAVLEYILHGSQPTIDAKRVKHCTEALDEYARGAGWTIKPGITVGSHRFASILEDKSGQKVGLWVIHPLQARPSPLEKQEILSQHGIRCAVHTSFDLERRPFWVMNNLVLP